MVIAALGVRARLEGVEPEDAPTPAKALLDEIHRSRGEFLAVMADIEESLNHIILLYFRVQPTCRVEFTNWILAAMRFADKVDLVAKITRSSLPGSTMNDIVAWLKNLSSRRNEIAHSGVSLHIGPDQGIQDAIEDWRWASSRRTRGGIKSYVVDSDGMKKGIISARYLNSLLFTVMDEMAKAPERLVPIDIDWRVTRNDRLDDRGIPQVSDELHQYFTEYGYRGSDKEGSSETPEAP